MEILLGRFYRYKYFRPCSEVEHKNSQSSLESEISLGGDGYTQMMSKKNNKRRKKAEKRSLNEANDELVMDTSKNNLRSKGSKESQ